VQALLETGTDKSASRQEIDVAILMCLIVLFGMGVLFISRSRPCLVTPESQADRSFRAAGIHLG
jgi:hypothetical protein